MIFTPLASSSKGNAYLLEEKGSAPLLLECGIPIKQLRSKLPCYVSDLAGCLVSHEHGDHSRAIKDLLKDNVACYMSRGTAKALNVDGHYCVSVFDGSYSIEQVGPWGVYTFPLEHDAVEPMGFFILHPATNERFLFIPDTGFVRNRFEGVNILAIECNNIAEILTRNITDGYIPAVVGHRIRRNHMAMETLITMLKSNDLSKCRKIYLLHLSDGNSDEKRMIRAVQEATGIPTRVCEE